MTLLGGDGEGGFSAFGSAVPVSSRPYFAALEDVNGDGHTDLITIHAAMRR